MLTIFLSLFANIVACGLATGYTVAAWRDSSLFASRIEAIKDGALAGNLNNWFGTPGYVVGSFLSKLLLCPFCLSFWVSLCWHGTTCTIIAAELGWQTLSLLPMAVLASAAIGAVCYRYVTPAKLHTA